MTGKILIIEDSMVQAMRLQDELEEHGLQVRCANYGETGSSWPANGGPTRWCWI
jgi:DNA-binding response OmpR family regulator